MSIRVTKDRGSQPPSTHETSGLSSNSLAPPPFVDSWPVRVYKHLSRGRAIRRAYVQMTGILNAPTPDKKKKEPLRVTNERAFPGIPSAHFSPTSHRG